MSDTYTLTVTLDSGKVWHTTREGSAMAERATSHYRNQHPFNPVVAISTEPGDHPWEPIPAEIWDADVKNVTVKAILMDWLDLRHEGVFAGSADGDPIEVTDEFNELVRDGYVEMADGKPQLTAAIEAVMAQ